MMEEGDYISVIGSEATNYHNDTVHPYWADEFVRIRRIGKHIFYKKSKDEWLRPLPRPENFEEIIQKHKDNVVKKQNYKSN